MNYTIYKTETGQIVGNFYSGDASAIALNVKDDSYIEGEYRGNEYYIANGAPMALPQDPSTGLQKFQFDWTTKSWSLDVEHTASLARLRRNNILSQTVDRVNPIWYAALTAEQQTELSTYRTALLAVPEQAGWPAQIEWPSKPTWL